MSAGLRGPEISAYAPVSRIVRRVSSASQTSVNRVVTGAGPSRSRSGARKSPITPARDEGLADPPGLRMAQGDV